MDRNFGIYIIFGLLLGTIFGVAFGVAIGNILLGIGLGAFDDVFIGWFAALAVFQNQGE